LLFGNNYIISSIQLNGWAGIHPLISSKKYLIQEIITPKIIIWNYPSKGFRHFNHKSDRQTRIPRHADTRIISNNSAKKTGFVFVDEERVFDSFHLLGDKVRGVSHLAKFNNSSS
jgi:hypothetical protein